MQLTFPSKLCDAILQVETGGHPDPANAVGDGGRSIGPLQISLGCWMDAVEHDASIGGVYADCKDLDYAKKIFHSYLDRYAVFGDSLEVLARIWNGGPNGYRKEATEPYWRAVKNLMDVAGNSRLDRESGG